MDNPALHASLENSLLTGVGAEVALSQVSFNVFFVPLFLLSMGVPTFRRQCIRQIASGGGTWTFRWHGLSITAGAR